MKFVSAAYHHIADLLIFDGTTDGFFSNTEQAGGLRNGQADWGLICWDGHGVNIRVIFIFVQNILDKIGEICRIYGLFKEYTLVKTRLSG